MASATDPASSGGRSAIAAKARPGDGVKGSLTVNSDQTGGTSTIDISGTGTFSGGPMFTASSLCPTTVKAGTYSSLACAVLVTTNGTTTIGMKVTADLRAFGLSQTTSLVNCDGCGATEFDLDLHVPADMPVGTVPVSFTVADIGGRRATTTANLKVVQ